MFSQFDCSTHSFVGQYHH